MASAREYGCDVSCFRTELEVEFSNSDENAMLRQARANMARRKHCLYQGSTHWSQFNYIFFNNSQHHNIIPVGINRVGAGPTTPHEGFAGRHKIWQRDLKDLGTAEINRHGINGIGRLDLTLVSQLRSRSRC